MCIYFTPIALASGGVAGPDGYLDCRAAWICDLHHPECLTWRHRVRSTVELTYFEHVKRHQPRPWLIGTGTFGAFLASDLLNVSTLLWTPKDHGLPCSPFPPPPAGTQVMLVEDVVTTTACRECGEAVESEAHEVPELPLGGRIPGRHAYDGGTLWRMRRWCEQQGYDVVGEIVAAEVGGG